MEDREELETVLVGTDVVALFPSMTAENTGKIIREKVTNTKMKVEGFRWKKALVYIRLNRSLVKNIPAEVRRYLPHRRKQQGTAPGMGSIGLGPAEGSEEKQWIFPRNRVTEEMEKKIMGVVAEIAILILWRNYCYKFGGEVKIQGEGGPIGQRPTMAASRLVMTDLFQKYNNILIRSGLKIFLMKVYVDDGRQVTTIMKKGMRYSREEEKFIWKQEAEQEDLDMEKKGEKKDEFMARLCLEAMNQINQDLTFTAEVESDFADNRLPTLDFSLWMRDDNTLTHTYFEKPMKTQLLMEQNSAMGKRQKYCILAEETTRRLYNMAEDREEEDTERVLEQMTRQLKNSGWSRPEIREILCSGYRGWRTRLKRREETCGSRYRSAVASLPSRARSKLTGKSEWFKTDNRKRKRETEDLISHKRMRKDPGKDQRTGEEGRIVSVMFVPYTAGGELARRLNEVEKNLGKQTGVRIKIAEKVGNKLVDMLHQADPWQGTDCQREHCLICKTKVKTEKDKRKDCTRRSIVYETWCLRCEETEEEKIREEEPDEKLQKEKMRKIKRHIYT